MNPKVKCITVRRAALIIAAALALPAMAGGNGSKSVGLRSGYSTYNESALAGIYFQYSFTDHFRLSPSADYVFRRNGTDGFAINLDAQVPFAIGSGRWSVYPLAGLSYVTWSSQHTGGVMPTSNNVYTERHTTRTTRFGLDAGAGVEWSVTSTLKLMAEGRFNWVKHNNAGVFTIGIGYVF